MATRSWVFPEPPAGGTKPEAFLTVNPQGYRAGEITGITYLKDAAGKPIAGSGYDYAPISGNSATQPGGQFAGPGGLRASFSTTPAPPDYLAKMGASFTTPSPIYLPVNSAANRSGYQTPPTVTFSLPPTGGKQAAGVAVLGTGAASGTVVAITITEPGYGYASPPMITLSGGGATTAATATATIGEINEPSPRALETVYAYYQDHPKALAAMFNNPNYQDVSLPKLSEEFYWPLNWASFGTPTATDGTKTPQGAIATFSLESINRSNTFVDGVYQPGVIARTSLDSKYQPDDALLPYNSYGGTFSGLSSLSYDNFIGFLNEAATIIADAATAGGATMTPQDVTFQLYDVAFLPVEWLTETNSRQWKAAVSRPQIQPTTMLTVDDAVIGPKPIHFGIAHLAAAALSDPSELSFVVNAVASGRVEKWDGSRWVDVSTPAVSAHPRELLSRLAARTIRKGDQLRWVPPPTPGREPLAFSVVGWKGESLSAGMDVGFAPPERNTP